MPIYHCNAVHFTALLYTSLPCCTFQCITAHPPALHYTVQNTTILPSGQYNYQQPWSLLGFGGKLLLLYSTPNPLNPSLLYSTPIVNPIKRGEATKGHQSVKIR